MAPVSIISLYYVIGALLVLWVTPCAIAVSMSPTNNINIWKFIFYFSALANMGLSVTGNLTEVPTGVSQICQFWQDWLYNVYGGGPDSPQWQMGKGWPCFTSTCPILYSLLPKSVCIWGSQRNKRLSKAYGYRNTKSGNEGWKETGDNLSRMVPGGRFINRFDASWYNLKLFFSIVPYRPGLHQHLWKTANRMPTFPPILWNKGTSSQNNPLPWCNGKKTQFMTLIYWHIVPSAVYGDGKWWVHFPPNAHQPTRNLTKENVGYAGYRIP